MRAETPLIRPPCTALAALVVVLAAGLAAGPSPALALPTATAAAAAHVSPASPAVASAAARPVTGPVVRPFDPPEHPYGPGHRGVDLGAEAGAPVASALDGHVVFSGQVAGVGWVTVDHGGGLVTTYGDLVDRIATGAAVPRGDVIGRLADGAAHVDWGARLDGTYIDPLLLLRRWRLHLAAP